jgi:hypothetical protein
MLLGMDNRERTAVLVLRIWTETDAIDGVRARIASDTNRAVQASTSVAGGSVDDVVDLVRRWVLEFVNASQCEGES